MLANFTGRIEFSRTSTVTISNNTCFTSDWIYFCHCVQSSMVYFLSANLNYFDTIRNRDHSKKYRYLDIRNYNHSNNQEGDSPTDPCEPADRRSERFAGCRADGN